MVHSKTGNLSYSILKLSICGIANKETLSKCAGESPAESDDFVSGKVRTTRALPLFDLWNA